MSGLEKRRALLLIAVLAVAATLAVAGCGGGGTGSPETATSEEESTSSPHRSTQAEEDSGSAEHMGELTPLEGGERVFAANCGSCHTLKAAGTSGEAGPNLDELGPDQGTVERQVESGGGGMPSFKGTLTPEEITDVAAYVSAEAGS
jgi:cytochrome c553